AGSAECRRTFDSIQQSKASAGSCSGIQHSSAGLNRSDSKIHGFGDIRDCGGDNAGDLCVFGVDDFQNSLGWKKVDVDGSRVSSFGTHRLTYILFRCMPDVDVRIRRAAGLDDYLACVALQKEVWKYTEMEDIAAQ